MKLAGLTWWRNNYGSILQAYALQRYLMEYENIDYEILNQYSKKMASLNNLVDKFKTIGLLKTFQRLIGRFGLKKLRLRVASMQKFVDDNLVVSENVYNEETIGEANQKYDGFICGSDQIWNPLNTSLDSMYWLEFVQQGKLKISYAPSIGVESVKEIEAMKIKHNLHSFHAVSCREETGTQMINHMAGEIKCKTVLDPTMLVEKKMWDDLCSERVFNGNYIFAYLLRGTKQERLLIEKYAQTKKLPIVTMPFLDGEKMVLYDFKFGTYKLWHASPAEFISAIRYAECIFTDSFHCMVFSCLYHKDFFTFPKVGKSQMSRIVGLQELLETGNRMITAHVECQEIESMTEIDWERVDSILANKRAYSQQYLREALRCF